MQKIKTIKGYEYLFTTKEKDGVYEVYNYNNNTFMKKITQINKMKEKETINNDKFLQFTHDDINKNTSFIFNRIDSFWIYDYYYLINKEKGGFTNTTIEYNFHINNIFSIVNIINNNDNIKVAIVANNDYILYDTQTKTIFSLILNDKILTIDDIVTKNENSYVIFIKYINEFLNLKPIKKLSTKNYIKILLKHGNQYDTKSVEINRPKINLALNYGDEFIETYKNIKHGLINNDKGLWLFHGTPGTGKTNFIKYLMFDLQRNKKLKNKVLYLTPESVAQIDTPDFLSFMMDLKDYILIIEDADIALKDRNLGGNIVKTLLNLTDGILADILNIKVVATFNTNESEIDKALLRKGRLMYKHNFLPISKDNAIKLAQSLGKDISKLEDNKEYILTDVYNLETNNGFKNTTKKLGY